MSWLNTKRHTNKKNSSAHRFRPRIENLETRLVMDGSLLTDIPVLESLPGASATLYLDFDGHEEDSWFLQGGPAAVLGFAIGGPIGYLLADELAPAPTTPVFDFDGDRTTFCADELTVMRGIWEVVAEDYRPFNINVTTVAPASIRNGRDLRVSIGGDGDWYITDAGGVGFPDSFTSMVENCVFVFSELRTGTTIDPASPPDLNQFIGYLGTTASHEAGHAFGLYHQADFRGDDELNEYSIGDPGADGVFNAGPGERLFIMGAAQTPLEGPTALAANAFDATVRATWWNSADTVQAFVGGTRTTQVRNNLHDLPVPEEDEQDDLALLAGSDNAFGYRADDHSNRRAGATNLISAGTFLEVGGVIEQMSDVDFFRVQADFPVRVSVRVPAQWANLDVRAELYDDRGNLLATNDPDGDLNAQVTIPRSGVFFVAVRSHGTYGDLGSYTVSLEDSGPRVSRVSQVGSEVRIDFDKPIDPASIIPGTTLTVSNKDGSVSIIPTVRVVEGTGNRSIMVSFTPSVSGGYRIRLTPEIRDAQGRRMDGNGNFIQGEMGDGYETADFEGPRITSNGLVSPTKVRVTFDGPINAATFSASDVRITDLTSGAAIPVVAVEPASGPGARSNEFEITLGATPGGNYQLQIGPDVRDPFFNKMDQDRDRNSGELEQDRYVAVVFVSAHYVRTYYLGERLRNQADFWNGTPPGILPLPRFGPPLPPAPAPTPSRPLVGQPAPAAKITLPAFDRVFASSALPSARGALPAALDEVLIRLAGQEEKPTIQTSVKTRSR